MYIRISRYFCAVFVVCLLAGCGSVLEVVKKPGGVAASAAHRFFPAKTEKMRVLRAELVLAVIAYVGSKRIERAESQLARRTRAEAFLVWIRGTQTMLKQTADAAETGNPWFEVRMNGAVDEFIELTKNALSKNTSVISSLNRLAAGTAIQRLAGLAGALTGSVRIFRGTRAILQGVNKIKKKIGERREPIREDWDDVEKLMRIACGALGESAKNPNAFDQYCKWKGPLPS